MTDTLPPLLEGVRILDLSAVISGPLATGLMADQGAEVWKVESLAGGDMTRALGAQHRGLTAMFATVNRNKKSIALDLKDPRGRDALLALAAQCDVFVENFRPGAAARLGLDYEAIKAVRPEVIYLSISGFGPEGPYTKRRVYDPVIQAVSGLAEAQGGAEPSLMRTLVCDKVTALTAAQALSAALFARAQGKGGRRLSLSMLDAALYFNWSDLFWNHTFLSPEAETHPELADTFGISRTADGHLCAIVGAGVDFSDFTTEGAMAALDEYDIPCAPALPRAAVPDDPQVQASESLVPHEHPVAGPMRQPRPPVRDGAPLRLAPAPLLGADTEAVLAEAGLSAEAIAALRAAGGGSVIRSVAVYCGFRLGASPAYGAAADALGAGLAAAGVTLVYGGGGQGMMRRVADAALDAGGAVVGVIPEDLVEREQAHSGLSIDGGASRLEVVADMHERKARMLDLADAVAVLPGGFGTLDELFEVLTWAQLGIHAKPCGMINAEGYFDHLLAFLDHAEGEGYVRPADRARITVAPSAPELLAAWALGEAQ